MKKILLLFALSLSFWSIVSAFNVGVDDKTVLYKDIITNYMSEYDTSHYGSKAEKIENAQILFDKLVREEYNPNKTVEQNGIEFKPSAN